MFTIELKIEIVVIQLFSLDIAAGTAYNRLENLVDREILKGYTILLDSDKLGYNLTALILIEAEGRHLPEV